MAVPLKCASCLIPSGRPVKVWVVETNQSLCQKCVGLMTYPGLKGSEWTLEEIDTKNRSVRGVAVFLTSVSALLLGLASVWYSNVGNEYFQGASTCPALGVGRQALARFDANVFYYYKSSLAIFCDTEDSFWRLILDGWIRGVVTGSDSFLLLFSTLPKALLFKTVVFTFLRPVYAFVYATTGFLLDTVLMRLQILVRWVMKMVLQQPEDEMQKAEAEFPAAQEEAEKPRAEERSMPCATQEPEPVPPPQKTKLQLLQEKAKQKAVNACSSAKDPAFYKQLAMSTWRTPGRMRKYTFSRWLILLQAKMVFWGLAAGVLLRLVLYLLGSYFPVLSFFKTIAALGVGGTEVNMWQMVFEPMCFWYLGRLCIRLQAHLDKTIWKTEKQAPSFPPTLWRKKPFKDFWERRSYTWERVLRSWTFYKKKAEEVLGLLVDDIFNMVVVLRLLGICLSLAPLARQVASSIGLSELIVRHQTLFSQATGIAVLDNGSFMGSYISDRLAAFGTTQALAAGQVFASEVQQDVARIEADGLNSLSQHFAWRILVPLAFYVLQWSYSNFIKKQHGKSVQAWRGEGWKGGLYEAQLEQFGSFWNEVRGSDQWATPQLKGGKKK